MYPDRFAVIAPSAGWRDFFTYGGTRRGSDKDPIREILDRALNTSDSSLLTRNHAQHAVYILHGAKDATVPVSEGRAMRDALAPFHEDFRYHEEPKATHWWGNACVDWPPFFELFSRRTNPRKREKVDFTSVSPGIAGTCYGVTIEQQVKPFAVSRVRAIPSDRESQIRVTTENVARLSVDCRVLGLDAGAALTIDGQRIPAVKSSGARIAHVVRGEAGWERLREPLIGEKSSRRSGPFKDAFRNRFLYVVGTKGTPEENAWALARARYDAETFWVRGNGSVDIALDKDFDPGKERDRSVILLGNADTNAAWKPLLGKSPLQITRDSIRIGDKSLDGSRLGAHFVRPRPGSDVACVAVIGGTGLEGMRLTLRMPIFVSGVAYPDWCVVGPSAEAPGGYGFVAAGFFANDWSVNPSDSAFAPQVK
jgi:hypothetical protein